MFDERYDTDIVSQWRPRRGPVARRPVTLARGLVIEHSDTEFCGAVVGLQQGGLLLLEDGRGQVRQFPLSDSFLIDGEPVELVKPRAPQRRKRTASGSFADAQPTRAKVARASRIFVEGRHDAELIEQVWGDDLRHVGVVVELLEGADRLAEVLEEFQPAAGNRAGVLLDHLVDGSKESRIAEQILRSVRGAEHVKILGHPFIDIWAAVRPERLGLKKWPDIPRDQDWKTGICQALGFPAVEQADIAEAWSRIRGRVRDYRDLEPALAGRVEELIDFVTEGQP